LGARQDKDDSCLRISLDSPEITASIKYSGVVINYSLKGGKYVGSVEKIPLERLSRPKIDISFRCPVCKAATIRLTSKNMDRWEDVRCPVCSSIIIFEGFSISVVRQKAVERKEIQGKGAVSPS